MNVAGLARYLCLLPFVSTAALAQSVPTVIQTSPQADAGVYSGRLKVPYPTQYEPASAAEIRATTDRVYEYLQVASPVEVLNAETGERVVDLDRLPAHVSLARTDLLIATYEWGVTYAGMLRMAEVAGDRKYRDYTDTRVAALAKLAAHENKRVPSTTTAKDFPRPKHGMGAARHAPPERVGRCRRDVCRSHQSGTRRAWGSQILYELYERETDDRELWQCCHLIRQVLNRHRQQG